MDLLQYGHTSSVRSTIQHSHHRLINLACRASSRKIGVCRITSRNDGRMGALAENDRDTNGQPFELSIAVAAVQTHSGWDSKYPWFTAR
jgi:hypothetical protein